MKVKRIKQKIVKPNIIPILDAVFIFIFFLLMSAQFLEIYQIGSDAPSVKTVSEETKNDKPILNLTLEIQKDRLIIKTGIDGDIYKEIINKKGNYDLDVLNFELAKIKQKHISEDSIVLKPNSEVRYKKVVFIMDSVRQLMKESPSIVAKNKKGRVVSTRELFKQIIFETII